MWNGGCVIEPRKGSIEVGGSLWYNGLVFALCQAIPVGWLRAASVVATVVARTRNEAMADARFPLPFGFSRRDIPTHAYMCVRPLRYAFKLFEPKSD